MPLIDCPEPMTKTDAKTTPAQAARAARLAEELRANLRKRKDKTRKIGERQGDEGASDTSKRSD